MGRLDSYERGSLIFVSLVLGQDGVYTTFR